jgi:tetratricopeptide (TPR) repeat protein
MRVQLFLASIIALTLSVAVFAQPAASPEMTAAAELMKQQKFADAAVIYEKLVRADPKNGPAWYYLGSARFSLKDYRGAADAYEHNIPISGNPFAMYNLACAYSRMGQNEKALDELSKAIDDPKMVVATINFDDPDLAAISGDPRFAALRGKVDRVVRPCMYSDEAKQLNFWVGEWDVYNPQGRKDGTSSIQSFASGCGILENWTGTFGGGGKSINFYDAGDKKWHQYWIGAAGGPQRYIGAYSDGAIRYVGEPTPSGPMVRLTFFNIDANTVRQLSERSADSGKTWQVNYDYKYVRRKQ